MTEVYVLYVVTPDDLEQSSILGAFSDRTEAFKAAQSLEKNRKRDKDTYLVATLTLDKMPTYNRWNRLQLVPSDLEGTLLYYLFDYDRYLETGTWLSRDYMRPEWVEQPRSFTQRYIAASTEEEALEAWEYYILNNPILAQMFERDREVQGGFPSLYTSDP